MISSASINSDSICSWELMSTVPRVFGILIKNLKVFFAFEKSFWQQGIFSAKLHIEFKILFEICKRNWWRVGHIVKGCELGKFVCSFITLNANMRRDPKESGRMGWIFWNNLVINLFAVKYEGIGFNRYSFRCQTLQGTQGVRENCCVLYIFIRYYF